MLAQSLSPFAITPESLDEYLLKGWFRMGQTIFTTNFLHFKDEFYSAIWLRIDLNNFSQSTAQKKIQKQNARFKVVTRQATFDDSKEELYRKYRASISFDASSSVHQLMFGSASFNIYSTYEVCVFDNDKLIACGFFDLGNKAAAGISSFYDPQYRKFSLGKYLIMHKILHCKDLGLQYFYPGYFVPGYPAFDYKLQLTSSGLEFLELATSKWRTMSDFSDNKIPYAVMTKKIQELKSFMPAYSWTIWNYAYFDANILIDVQTAQFVDYPVFLAPIREEDLRIVVVYNMITGRYDVIRCQSFLLSTPPRLENVLSTHLLRKDEIIFSSENCQEISVYLLKS
jgi:arginyl-tRNA--protein-N-Asp/Glu arginylyltransferase